MARWHGRRHANEFHGKEEEEEKKGGEGIDFDLDGFGRVEEEAASFFLHHQKHGRGASFISFHIRFHRAV